MNCQTVDGDHRFSYLQKKIDRFNEDLLELVGEHGTAEECVAEVNKAGQLKVTMQETLVKIKQSL